MPGLANRPLADCADHGRRLGHECANARRIRRGPGLAQGRGASCGRTASSTPSCCGCTGSIGDRILGQQRAEGWGTRVIARLAVDLRTEFPDMRGLSARNRQ